MVFETVRSILAEQLEVEESSITMDTNIIEDLGADSLDVVELITALESQYDIVIADDSAAELFTVREVVEFLEDYISK